MKQLGKKLLYLSRTDVESLGISIADIIDRLELMFIEKCQGKVEMPPKPAIHTNGDAFLHAMPAFIPAFESAGMKWVGGYPENHKLGIPYITGLLVLNDVVTGVPYAVMDCTWITAVRTAAVTALTAKYLASANTATVAILGCGVQGRYNLETIAATFDLKAVKVFDISDEIAEKYKKDMQQRYNFEIIISNDPMDTVQDADIVVTAGPFLMNPKPVIEFDWIKPGALLCPLDLDSYLKPEIFVHSSFLCSDDVAQFNHFKHSGLFASCPENISELADVIAGQVTGRMNNRQIITAINIGLALEDMAVAPLIYTKATEADIGQWLNL